MNKCAVVLREGVMDTMVEILCWRESNLNVERTSSVSNNSNNNNQLEEALIEHSVIGIIITTLRGFDVVS